MQKLKKQKRHCYCQMWMELHLPCYKWRFGRVSRVVNRLWRMYECIIKPKSATHTHVKHVKRQPCKPTVDLRHCAAWGC